MAMTSQDAQLHGRLFVVATPIGNLGDLSPRALQTLKEVSFIACEDTRRTGQLLRGFGISPKSLLSCFDHNETEAARDMVRRLERGENGALVSSAGTPLISDPGFEIMRQLATRKIQVVPIPGASAITTALSVCPIPCSEFLFLGFLPRKGATRTKALRRVANSPVSVVFFETARRIRTALARLCEFGAGDRPVFVAREMTKLFEEYRYGTLLEMQALLPETGSIKGELVCVVSPAPRTSAASDEVVRLIQILSAALPPAAAARLAAKISGWNRDRTYELALQVLDDK